MGEVLRVQDLSFSYGDNFLLEGINFSVEEGSILAILGPNGSGKTTLLKVLDGILRPSKGEVFVLSKPISRLKRKDISRLVAMVGQEAHFGFSFTALEVVLMGRFPHLTGLQMEGVRDLKKAREVMELTDTLNLKDRSINELSGGEKQRVQIARALAQEAKLMLLDEPTSFLDPHYKMEIFSLVGRIVKEKGMAAIVVTHDLDLSAQFCDSFLLLKEGKVLAQGKAREVLTQENIRKLYGCGTIVDENPITKTLRITLIPRHFGGGTC
jgi:iron complex transport system ATP-binding protein